MNSKVLTSGKSGFPLLFWGVLVLGVAIFVETTAVVQAHAELLSASPEPGATVTTPVTQIELVFSEPVSADSSIILFDDTFKQIAEVSTIFDETEPTVLKATVPQLAAGNYTVQFTAVSADGHEIGGSYSFRVSESNVPLSPQQLGFLAVGIILVAGFVVLWRRAQKQVTDQRQS